MKTLRTCVDAVENLLTGNTMRRYGAGLPHTIG
jgi:hypothetical protein